MKFDHIDPAVKATGDALSIVTVVGTLAQWLPAVAALASIIWSGFRIYETKTVQGWLGKKVDNVQKD
jgi:hypothetical protein